MTGRRASRPRYAKFLTSPPPKKSPGTPTTTGRSVAMGFGSGWTVGTLGPLGSRFTGGSCLLESCWLNGIEKPESLMGEIGIVWLVQLFDFSNLASYGF